MTKLFFTKTYLNGTYEKKLRVGWEIIGGIITFATIILAVYGFERVATIIFGD